MRKITAFLLLFLGCSSTAYSAVTLDRTRIIIEAEKKESTITIKKPPTSAVLVQSWVSTIDGKDIPFFTTTPPVSFVKANAYQQVSIIYQGQGAPEDRESLFYLNIQDSAAMSPELKDTNTISPAFLQMIKTFYRPPALKNQDPIKATMSLKWEIKNKTTKSYTLKIDNPTSFNIILSGIAITGKTDGKKTKLLFGNSDVDTIAPFSSVETVMKAHEGVNASNAQLEKLIYVAVDDFGMSNVFYGTISQNIVSPIKQMEANAKKTLPEDESTVKPNNKSGGNNTSQDIPSLDKIEFNTAPMNHGADLDSLVG